MTDDKALPSQSISLYFYNSTSNDWEQISTAQNIPNTQNGVCTVNDPSTPWVETGCFVWSGGSPTNNAYQIQVRATDSDSMTTTSTSNLLNGGSIKVLAGNTSSGVGGSAKSAIFFNSSNGEYTYADCS